MFASLTLIPGWTPDIAIGTSVLFLIPGVPLINGIIDILEGHTVTGTSRLIQATAAGHLHSDRARSAPAVIHEEPAMITDIITDGLLAAIAAVASGPSPTRPGKHSNT